jgi:hypothetical protein
MVQAQSGITLNLKAGGVHFGAHICQESVFSGALFHLPSFHPYLLYDVRIALQS